MDIFERLDNDGYFFSSKNRSTRGINFKGKISINDIDYYSKKVRISSPRSITAMNKLGINNKDLEFLTFKEYLHNHPELIAQNKEIQKIKYNYVEELRKRRIEQIKELRNEIPEEELVPLKKRCFSSKIRGQNEYFNYTLPKRRKYSNSFLDKDIRSFNRMRNINKAE